MYKRAECYPYAGFSYTVLLFEDSAVNNQIPSVYNLTKVHYAFLNYTSIRPQWPVMYLENCRESTGVPLLLMLVGGVALQHEVAGLAFIMG